jgi:hypothetical protein
MHPGRRMVRSNKNHCFHAMPESQDLQIGRLYFAGHVQDMSHGERFQWSNVSVAFRGHGDGDAEWPRVEQHECRRATPTSPYPPFFSLITKPLGVLGHRVQHIHLGKLATQQDGRCAARLLQDCISAIANFGAC